MSNTVQCLFTYSKCTLHAQKLKCFYSLKDICWVLSYNIYDALRTVLSDLHLHLIIYTKSVEENERKLN